MEWVFILPSIAILVTAGVTGVGLGLVGAGLNPILLAGVTVLGALGGAAVSFGLLLLAESRGPDSEVLAVAEGLVLTIVVPIVTTALGILLLARLMVAVRDWATTEAGLHPAVVTVGALFLAVAAVAMAVGLVQRLAREPTVESLTRGLGRHPADPDRLSDRASLYVKQGELELAATDYTRAIELEPFNLSDLLLARARLYAQQGRLGDAIADLTRTIELERDSTAALRDRAQLYAQRGDFDLAIGDASIVVEREVAPVHRASAHVERGRIFADRGDLELAIADYTRAIEISSPFEVSLVRVVEHRRATEPDYAGSIGDDYLWPYVWRGEARARGGDPEGASTDFDHALRLARLCPEGGTPQAAKSSRQLRDEIEAVMRSVGLETGPPSRV